MTRLVTTLMLATACSAAQGPELYSDLQAARQFGPVAAEAIEERTDGITVIRLGEPYGTTVWIDGPPTAAFAPGIKSVWICAATPTEETVIRFDPAPMGHRHEAVPPLEWRPPDPAGREAES